MRTKRRRETSLDPTLILERWLHIGSRVISLKDSIRQVQRRVILLRLRKASVEGTLERIVQTFHWCAEHAHAPALLRILIANVLLARAPILGADTIFAPRLHRDGALALSLTGSRLGRDGRS